MKSARLAVDIGGTFTDVAIEYSEGTVSAKTPTTPSNPVEGVMCGIDLVLTKTGLVAEDISVVIHGTTLATNALIERKGARVATITTRGFRDILEIAEERRYDQYDPYIDKTPKLVTRDRSYTLSERMDADGTVYQPLDESGIEDILKKIERDRIESIAVTFLHSYANPKHEQRVRDLLHEHRPDLSVSLSCEVCPEIGEYDRLSTTIANAYIRPLMSRYLHELSQVLKTSNIHCPLFIMTSGGGMTTVGTAASFPIRLVESGPCGGAILAAQVARQCSLDEVVSFDMGGTTAKVCLIDDGVPQTTRRFEIDRAARFVKGSGMPVLIPVIDMIEIGAGGGSIASIDHLTRLSVGPESAGAEPGPVSFGKGGLYPTVTDADTVMGLLDPDAFAEGRMKLDTKAATASIEQEIASKLQESGNAAADGISKIVDENMANAARVHAVEKGKDLARRTMIAFGGNGPLHATRVAERTGVRRIIIPANPGVGSAIGFLFAPVSYELVRSYYCLTSRFDFSGVNNLLSAMVAEARDVVKAGSDNKELIIKQTAFMRYRGQGHEIEVPFKSLVLDEQVLETLCEGYDKVYSRLYARPIPGMQIEVTSWSVTVSTVQSNSFEAPRPITAGRPDPVSFRDIYNAESGNNISVPYYQRELLHPGDRIDGPALIVESQTTTFLTTSFDASIDSLGNILIDKKTELPSS